MAAVVFLGAVFLLAASEQVLARAGSGLPLRRKLDGHALAAALSAVPHAASSSPGVVGALTV